MLHGLPLNSMFCLGQVPIQTLYIVSLVLQQLYSFKEGSQHATPFFLILCCGSWSLWNLNARKVLLMHLQQDQDYGTVYHSRRPIHTLNEISEWLKKFNRPQPEGDTFTAPFGTSDEKLMLRDLFVEAVWLINLFETKISIYTAP